MFGERVLVPPYRVNRIPTYQSHYVPEHAYYPSFRFESDSQVIIENLEEDEEHLPGATAQNGMREVQYYQCSSCEMIVRENDIPTHHCEGHDGS